MDEIITIKKFTKERDMSKQLVSNFKDIGLNVSNIRSKHPNLDLSFVDNLIPIVSKPFKTIECSVLAFEYMAKEIGKEIDLFLHKKILSAASALLSFFGLPNPYTIGLPFLLGLSISDFISNKDKTKEFIRENKEKFSSFVDGFNSSLYDGAWGLKIPDFHIEEIWSNLMVKITEFLNNFTINLMNLIFNIVKKIPGLGALVAFVDLTQGLKALFENIYNSAKQKYDELKSNFPIDTEALKRIKNEFISALLNFELPIIGSLASLSGLNMEEEIKKYKLDIKESFMSHLKNILDTSIEKLRQYLSLLWIKVLYDLISILPSSILSQFPILGKIITWCETIMGVLTGTIDEYTVLMMIFPDIDTIGDRLVAKVEETLGI